jgi:hypothetical protein
MGAAVVLNFIAPFRVWGCAWRAVVHEVLRKVVRELVSQVV